MKQKWNLKKCFFGLASAALLGGMIAACGSGDVSTGTTDDDMQLLLMKGEDGNSGYAGDIEMAVEACKLDASCAQKMNGAVYVSSAAESSSSTEIVEPGSSAAAVSSASVVTSSASINLSSAAVVSSSSAGLNLSSASVADGTVNGTCAPVPATISKGESTTWTFSLASGLGIAVINKLSSVVFDWTLEGSTEGSASGVGSKTTAGTYAASGSYGASLVVDGNTIQCSPLQVNGAAITGCTCTADASTVDVASGAATATWTVSGCTTNANITGYAWTDATGTGETATASFTAKGQTVAPTVAVSNDDNTVETFTCESVKAVDSSAPEYMLDGTTEGTYTVEPGTYSMLYACSQANQYYQPPIAVSASGSWDAFTVTYKGPLGTETTTNAETQHVISYSSLYGGSFSSMPTEQFTITVTHAAVIKCQ